MNGTLVLMNGLIGESGKDFKEAFRCDVITDEEANILKHLLLEEFDKYGIFPSGQDLVYFLEDE